jgi:hypothetical protein
VAKRDLTMHLIDVAPALAGPREIALALELADDAVGGALGDPDAVGDLAEPHSRIPGDAQEDVRVVGEEVEAGDDDSLMREALESKH